MASSHMRRFTISITEEMVTDLDWAKKEVYYKTSQNAMIRDLIARGIQSLEAEYQAGGATAPAAPPWKNGKNN